MAFNVWGCDDGMALIAIICALLLAVAIAPLLSARVGGPGAEISQMGVFLGVTLMGNLRIGCYFVLLQFRAVAHFRACLAAATALFCALRCLSVSSIHTSSLFDIVHTKAISKTVLKLGEATEMFGIPK